MKLFKKQSAAPDSGDVIYHMPRGSSGKIGSRQVSEAQAVLASYKNSKRNLERRIVENEKWWKIQHWDLIRGKENSDPEPASAWLFNAIANKHSDAMDSYPEPTVLPKEPGDEEQAKLLSNILPVLLERNDFEKTYSDVWWYKLKTGTGCYGVFWNNRLEDGRGDVDIRQIDILNLFWEGGIKDIQRSRNVFNVELVDNDILEYNYPFVKGKLGSRAVDVAEYLYDENIDTSGKSVVVDWYYKVAVGNRTVVHYCKFVGDIVLYASQNDPYYEDRGYYDHGMYPFVLDVLFTEEGTPCGFGLVDIMKDVQLYIDKLNQIIIKNAMQAGKRRFFISDNTGINEEEFADWSREFVHVAGNVDERNMREITVSQLDAGVVNLLYQKIDEIKEISGNRDVSSGGIAGGVTAASAIVALQEAGNKLSRDMIKSSYRAFRSINYMIIELIRQFYDDGRVFRIGSEDGGTRFINYQGSSVLADKRCVFDVAVTSSKSSPFSKTAQNELAKELFAVGLFNPARAQEAIVCIEMMDFEGKSAVLEKIRSNADTAERLETMNRQMQEMARIVSGNTDNTESIMTKASRAALPHGDKLAALSAYVRGGAI